jgi:hypothetical protein
MSWDWRGKLWTLLVTFCIVIIRCTETFWSPCIYASPRVKGHLTGSSDVTPLLCSSFSDGFLQIFRLISVYVFHRVGNVTLTDPQHLVKHSLRFLVLRVKIKRNSPKMRNCLFFGLWLTPVPVAGLSKAYVCGRSLAGIVGSNPARGIDVFLWWMLCAVR